ncbi:TIGR04141 family sporadically distributed protein [Amycolatopsis thermoflava]|uniref:TIGR04141 family sporadically distributed protein n=1 Tax=Amycolatopsis thermoflava TaxID=84480 RepID=UPI00365BD1A7
MPPRISCQPCTVYRLEGGLDLVEYLIAEADGVEYDAPVRLGDVDGHLLVGTRHTERPQWADHVQSLTGYDAELPGVQPYAVLLVPVGRWVFALTFGSGHQLIEDDLVDQGFGLMFGIRRLDTERLGSIASAALDVSARLSLTSFPGGSDLAGFRLEPFGELITRVTGSANLDGLTYESETHRRHQVRAGNSLSLPLPSSAHALVKDLAALTRIVDQPDEHSALRFVAQTRKLDRHHRLLPLLRARLATALGGETGTGPLALAWPNTEIRDIESAGSFRVNRLGRGGPLVLAPHEGLGDLVDRFATIDPSARLDQLRKAQVAMCFDTAGRADMGTPTSLRKWFAFETTIDNARYCYHQGEWFRIGEGFVEQIRDQVTELLTHRSDLQFPLWLPTGAQDDEHRYCEQVARQPGYLCLDQDFARTPFNPRLELCDIVGPGDELVHVKWLGRATAASHLFTQALAAAESLREEPEALQQLGQKVLARDRNRTIATPSTFVLAIADRPWSVDHLFTMSQISLIRLDRVMRQLRMRLEFAEIPFVSKKEAKLARHAA